MHLALLTLFLSCFLSGVVFLSAMSVSKCMNKSWEVSSSFECGFSPYKKSRVPFSLRFFLVTVMFLIFDVEVALVFPLGLLVSSNAQEVILFSSISIMVVLLLGLYYEWSNGVLMWV